MNQHAQDPRLSADDDEPDITMVDAGEGGPGEDPDFDEAGEGVSEGQRDEAG